MNFYSLRCFVKTAEAGSLSKAATELFITQPALTRTIKRLEQDLNVVLFERKPSGIHLTEAGETCYYNAKQILFYADQITDLRPTHSNKVSGIIRIGHCGAEGEKLLGFMEAISEHYPEITMKLYKNSIDALVDKLCEGHLDFSYIFGSDLVSNRSLQFLTIEKSHLQVITHKDHPLAAKKQVFLSELKNENFVTWNRDIFPKYYDSFYEICSLHGFVPKIVGAYSHEESLMSMVRNKKGIMIRYSAEEWYVNPKFYSVIDVQLECDTAMSTMNIALAWQKEYQNPLVPLIVKLAKSHFGRIS